MRAAEAGGDPTLPTAVWVCSPHSHVDEVRFEHGGNGGFDVVQLDLGSIQRHLHQPAGANTRGSEKGLDKSAPAPGLCQCLANKQMRF